MPSLRGSAPIFAQAKKYVEQSHKKLKYFLTVKRITAKMGAWQFNHLLVLILKHCSRLGGVRVLPISKKLPSESWLNSMLRLP